VGVRAVLGAGMGKPSTGELHHYGVVSAARTCHVREQANLSEVPDVDPRLMETAGIALILGQSKGKATLDSLAHGDPRDQDVPQLDRLAQQYQGRYRMSSSGP
jgi:hypothetical protein